MDIVVYIGAANHKKGLTRGGLQAYKSTGSKRSDVQSASEVEADLER